MRKLFVLGLCLMGASAGAEGDLTPETPAMMDPHPSVSPAPARTQKKKVNRKKASVEDDQILPMNRRNATGSTGHLEAEVEEQGGKKGDAKK